MKPITLIHVLQHKETNYVSISLQYSSHVVLQAFEVLSHLAKSANEPPFCKSTLAVRIVSGKCW